jgi:hypothetical protein
MCLIDLMMSKCFQEDWILVTEDWSVVVMKYPLNISIICQLKRGFIKMFFLTCHLYKLCPLTVNSGTNTISWLVETISVIVISGAPSPYSPEPALFLVD